MKKTRILIRLPNWLGDVVMALPVIRGIQNKHPLAEITLLCQPQFVPLLDALGVDYPRIELPKKGIRYYFQMFALRKHAFDIHVLFTNSERGDIEAFLIRAPKRIGIRRPGKKRRLLTHHYELNARFDEQRIHQTKLWENMAVANGVAEAADYTPYGHHTPPHNRIVGLICGTENTPEKRWPIAHWRALIEQLLINNSATSIQLYGTANDKKITDEVAKDFPEAQVNNLAGQTNLAEFMTYLKRASVVVCNDTGGMHLANAVGTPVVALFGPTNPIRTGPTYPLSSIVLQPSGCSPTGPMDIDGISPKRVLKAMLD